MTTAFLHFDGWAGRTKHPVEILKETPKRYKVQLLDDAYRYSVGHILYPPKWAVTDIKEGKK